MAYPTLTGWGTPSFDDANTGVLQRDVSPLLLEVLRRSPEFIGQIKTGTPAKNRIVEWFERDWITYQFTTVTTLAASDSDLQMVVTAGVPTKFEVGSLFMLVNAVTSGGVALATTNTTEVLQLKSIDSSTQFTFTRKFGGTSRNGTAIGNGSSDVLTFEHIGWPNQENSAPATNRMRGYGPSLKNYTEIFSFDMDESGTAQQMELYNMSDFWGTNLRELTEELKLQLNRSALYGVQQSSSPEGTSSAVRTMNGIVPYLSASGANLISSGYTTITEDLINALCRMIVAKNGTLNNRRGILLCSPANAEVIADIWKDKIQINREDTVRGTQVKTILTKLGFQLDVVWDANVHNKDLFVLNPTKIEIAPLRNRAWFVKKYDNGTDGETARILGEWTLRIWDAKKDHAYCNCLTTSW